MLRHHRRVFTTECTENTEGMRRKRFLELQNCFSPHPLSDLCELCGEYTRATKRGLTQYSRLRLRGFPRLLPATYNLNVLKNILTFRCVELMF
jgi:hypothetical protein